MSVSPAGNYSLTLDGARNLLAGSGTYQDLMLVTTGAQAKEVTWWQITDDVNAYEASQMPRAIVQYGGPYTVEKKGTTNWTSTAPIDVVIEVEIPSEFTDDIESGGKWFANQIGTIVDEMKTLVGNRTEDALRSGYTYLEVTEFMIEYTGRGDPQKHPEGRPYYVASLSFETRGL